jgi:dihydrofolate reductase
MSERKLILSMQITLDGYVADPDDNADWITNNDEEWADHFTDLSAADTYLLGRKMYPGYSQYWQSVLTNPNPDPNELKFAQLAEKSRHIVFTKGDFKPDWKNTKVAHDLPAEVARLKKEDGKNIIAWGGAAFAVSLIDLGLVDEYRLGINPTILTKGKALFANLKQRKKLVLISSKTVESDMIIARYRSSGPAKLGN